MEYKYLCRQITNQCIIAMAKVGYIFNSEQYDTFTFDRAWMEKYGCCRIIEDSASQEKTRPEWKQLMDCLERGDELVISKFSNALRGVRELAMFLEFCRVKVIRIISIQDKIDSKCELFPSTSIADVLFMFGSLSEEVVALRKAATHVEYIKSGIKPAKSSTPKKGIDRERNIVNMYNNNYTIDDIWKVSGFRSRSSVFRILNKYGVKLNRGKFSGPLGKRKPKNESEI